VPIDDVGDARNEQLIYRRANDLKLQNRRMKHNCKETIRKILQYSDKCLQVIEEVKKLRFVKPAENEILSQKTKELQQGE
jgi:hypothetical protein